MYSENFSISAQLAEAIKNIHTNLPMDILCFIVGGVKVIM